MMRVMRERVWPRWSAEELAEAGCEEAETLDELLCQSDVVSLHCPPIEETRDLIGEHELEVMKPSAYLVNTARGECVDEATLLMALDESVASGGRHGIRAVALDTLAHEARERNERLVRHPRCVVTPHGAYDSLEATDALCLMGLQAVCELLLEGRRPTWCVS